MARRTHSLTEPLSEAAAANMPKLLRLSVYAPLMLSFLYQLTESLGLIVYFKYNRGGSFYLRTSTSNICCVEHHRQGQINRIVDGLDHAGQHLSREAARVLFEIPLTQPKLFPHFGLKPLRRILLHGPAGTRKTLLSRATEAL
ncbi:hypothetical protein HYPSUDRAFT_919559 [Hypholoma sublateritium FD-334 SS-4]|uniref:ATPase AAA-type core domain-containing protein n=1 Tax=Hypholoma sublateritium (strain FD-334 SS-4) TaxID=945553 RepID=A0A0D2PEQ6_HYPSF|nr:hypothetical protein HYPSUDRAFT_919559 [Hypholoma sublateritium FD-334 SS-4]